MVETTSRSEEVKDEVMKRLYSQYSSRVLTDANNAGVGSRVLRFPGNPELYRKLQIYLLFVGIQHYKVWHNTKLQGGISEARKTWQGVPKITRKHVDKLL
jgi:hypothetical protein